MKHQIEFTLEFDVAIKFVFCTFIPIKQPAIMMNHWSQYPFVRFIIPFVVGIATAIGGVQIDNLIGYLSIAIVLYLLMVVWVFRHMNYSWRWLPGLMIMVIFWLGGYLLATQKMPDLGDSGNLSENNSLILQVELFETPVEKPKSYKTIAHVLNVNDSSLWKASQAKILIYFEKSDKMRKLEYGDQLLLSGKPQSIAPPRNPGEFDYRRYLLNMGITHQVYVKNKDWKLLSHTKGNPLVSYGLQIRRNFLNLLRDNGLSGSEFAVASALLLGYDDYLDQEQKQQFAGAGVMHILCVSGLHVGILAFLLEFLLGFMSRKKFLRHLKIVIIIGSIWLYAAITGFSPSVMRAATMFSFIILGRSLNRKANIFNMLAASAFILLLINPLFITQVGFQLSYIAVLGIVLLYKPIVLLLNPKIKLLEFIWKITVVSIAATISTLPLSLYYFHQFPVLFLITNLIAIPAATLIIYLGLLVLISSFVPFVSTALAVLLSWVIWGLNVFVAWIDGLPFAVITNIYITQMEAVSLILFVASIIAIIYLKKRSYAFLAVIIGSIFLSSITIRRYQAVKQSKMIVYGVRKATAIDFIHGKQCLLFCDSAFITNPALMEFGIKGNRILSGINQSDQYILGNDSLQNNWFYEKRGFINFLDQRFLVVRPDMRWIKTNEKLKMDYILLSGNPKISMKQLNDCFRFQQIIFDLSNSPWKVREWVDECDRLEIPYYDIREKGAWELNI